MELLRELIKDKGMTITEFCKDAKISSSTVGNWLSGCAKPGPASLKKLAKYFNVPIERFESALDDAETQAVKTPQKKTPQRVTIETPVSELPAEVPEKTITRAEYIRASKRSMEKLQEIMGESKSAMLAAEFLRCDTERRLW